jgi:nucleotide-binding universal stress UspA family protein
MIRSGLDTRKRRKKRSIRRLSSSEKAMKFSKPRGPDCRSNRITTFIYRGIPSEEILREAEMGDYDLVVIAASGVMDLKHQMLGSVSSKVAWNAPCSVLLVRTKD